MNLGFTREAEVENTSQQRRQIQRLRKALKERDRRIARLEEGNCAVRAENVVWIFGTARTGSTWLGSMMEEMEGQVHWREPYVGALFGNFYYGRPESHRKNRHFIMGQPRKAWLKSIRSFVLEAVAAKFPELGGEGYVAVKEPHGSHGAPLLMEALPESRMIFLVRDPRDVAASALDARKKGSWVYERRRKRFGGDNSGDEETVGGKPPEEIVRDRAKTYLRDVRNVKVAYEAHEGRKVLVRYEDLRTDTLQTMKRIYRELEIPVDEGDLSRSVEKHAFENLPQEKKGQGKFHRKATPGGWQEDLTPDQADIVQQITSPLLEEFYGDNREVRTSPS